MWEGAAPGGRPADWARRRVRAGEGGIRQVLTGVGGYWWVWADKGPMGPMGPKRALMRSSGPKWV